MQEHPDGFVQWEELQKKDARGQNDLDLGSAHEIGPGWVHTVKGVVTKTHYYIPKSLVQGYDGHKIWFNITENQVNQFTREQPPTTEDYRNRFGALGTYSNIESTVPMIPEAEHGRWQSPAPLTGLQETPDYGLRRSTTTVGRLGEPTAGLRSPGSEQHLTREDLRRPRRDKNEY